MHKPSSNIFADICLHLIEQQKIHPLTYFLNRVVPQYIVVHLLWVFNTRLYTRHDWLIDGRQPTRALCAASRVLIGSVTVAAVCLLSFAVLI